MLGLGAGGSHPANIPVVDKVNIVGASVTIVVGFFGGSINNQIGPRYTLILAASGYPVYIGSLWWLDRGSGPLFAYFAGVWHGISAALLYSAAGERILWTTRPDRPSPIDPCRVHRVKLFFRAQ